MREMECPCKCNGEDGTNAKEIKMDMQLREEILLANVVWLGGLMSGEHGIRDFKAPFYACCV